MEHSDQPQNTALAEVPVAVPDSAREVIKKKPFLLGLRSNKWFIIITITIAVFTDIFLYAIVVPVFPYELEDRVGVSKDGLQEMISMLLAAYGIGLIVFSIIAGWLADKFPQRRTPLLLGLFVLTGATIMTCVARNYPLLFVGRLLQGGSSGVVWTVGLALLVDTVGSGQVGNAMGTVLLGMSLGTLVAPPLGGVVYEHGGYYAVYGMCFALLAFDIFLRLILIEKKDAMKYYTAEELLELEGTIDEPSLDSTEEKALAEDTADEQASEKVQKPSKLPAIIFLLRYPRLLAALFASLVVALSMTALESTLPLHAEEIFDFGPTAAGLLFLATVIPSFSSPYVGMLVDKYGARWIAASGFLLAAPFWILLRLPDGDNSNRTGEVVKLCTLMVFIGFGITFSLTSLAEVQLFLEDLERKQPGLLGKNGATAQGYGLYNVFYSIGTVVGPLWAGFLRDSHGWKTMTWTFGLLLFVSSIPTALFIGGYLFEKKEKNPVELPNESDADRETTDKGVERAVV